MGKGRAPCCDKSTVKRGPWSPKEDLTLITFIQKHGHHNWRSLPKQAGLMRCGKSCRLRWINYLRPDVKRGNFTKEEEDAIIHFHHTLGNKWSKIASFLPGRTDNEIKNVWNTHLKKRLSSVSSPSSSSSSPSSSSVSSTHDQSQGQCEASQDERLSGFKDPTTLSHEANELHQIQVLLDHDDVDHDITFDEFLRTSEMLFPELPLNCGTELEVTNKLPFDHHQPDTPRGNEEFDMWAQLVEPSSSPDTEEEYKEWFNFVDNHNYFDDFNLVGEVCW